MTVSLGECTCLVRVRVWVGDLVCQMSARLVVCARVFMCVCAWVFVYVCLCVYVCARLQDTYSAICSHSILDGCACRREYAFA